MRIPTIIAQFSVFTLFLLVPASTSAYTSTAQHAIQISDTQALYTVEFGFSTRENDFFIPIQAVANVPYGSDRDVVGFSVIEDRAGVATDVTTHSIILSDAEVVDGMYRIPAGETQLFTLVTFVTVPSDRPDAEYLIQVTSLPHYVGIDRERRFVNDVELRSFISPGVELNLPPQHTD